MGEKNREGSCVKANRTLSRMRKTNILYTNNKGVRRVGTGFKLWSSWGK
jgi:hypothetical protein